MRRAGHEEHQTHEHVEEAAGGGIEQREQSAEEEQTCAEILHEDHEGHRQRPDGEQRPQIAERRQGHAQEAVGAHRERLADIDQVGGEEDNEQDLADFSRLEVERPQVDPEPGPVDLAGHDSGHQQREQAEHADDVAEAAQPAQVADEREHQEEGDQADDQPHGLLEGQVFVDAVEQHDAQGGEERGHRQQIGIGLRSQEAGADVGDQEEYEEERPVRERRELQRRRLLRVHEGEPQCGEDQRRDEEDEFAVTQTH